MAHGQLDDEAATRLCAQLLTLDAEGDEPIRFELQNLGAGLSAALTVMGVLDVVGVPVQARAAGQISGPALGVLAACGQRCAYPNAVFVLSEPTIEFDGTMMAITAREERTGPCWTRSISWSAEATGREVDEVRGDARAHRILTAGEAQRYGLLTEQIERDRAPPRPRKTCGYGPQDQRLRGRQDQRVTGRRTSGYGRRTSGYGRRTSRLRPHGSPRLRLQDLRLRRQEDLGYAADLRLRRRPAVTPAAPQGTPRPARPKRRRDHGPGG